METLLTTGLITALTKAVEEGEDTENKSDRWTDRIIAACFDHSLSSQCVCITKILSVVV